MRAQKRDANEAEIVDALLEAGYMVMRCYSPFPVDLLVWKRGKPFLLLEVKSPSGRATEAQETFFALTEGCMRAEVNSPQKALEAASAWLGKKTTDSDSCCFFNTHVT